MSARKRLLAAYLVPPAVLLLLVAGCLLWWTYPGVPEQVDTSFATAAFVRCHYSDMRSDADVSDPVDLRTLKTLLSGPAYGRDVPACMFTTDVSITLTGHGRRVVFCPGFCADGIVAVEGTDKYRYLSRGQTRMFNHICKKYGLDFAKL